MDGNLFRSLSLQHFSAVLSAASPDLRWAWSCPASGTSSRRIYRRLDCRLWPATQGYGIAKLRHELSWQNILPLTLGTAIGIPIG